RNSPEIVIRLRGRRRNSPPQHDQVIVVTEEAAAAMVVYKSIFDGGELRSELENAGIHPLNLEQLRLGRHPSLPSAAYLILNSKFMPLTSSVHSVDESVDGVTSKLLIKLQVITSLC
ncbi:hypothetical protein AKJ16_DCAP27083, partial [Drosera capensis]